jgi:hypothetical protein
MRKPLTGLPDSQKRLGVFVSDFFVDLFVDIFALLMFLVVKDRRDKKDFGDGMNDEFFLKN